MRTLVTLMGVTLWSRRIGLGVRMAGSGLASVLYNQMWWQRGAEVGDIREAIRDRLSGAFKTMTKRLGYF